MSVSAVTRGWLGLQEWGLQRMDGLAARTRRGPGMAPHLTTGLRGERAALFHLRRLGYTVVARRWTSAKMRGDLDLIGWDGDWLCFIEVKTRTVRDMSPAEAAVDQDKQRMVRGLARAYMKAFQEERRRLIPVRFDVVAVYLLESGVEFEVYQGAFQWQ